MGPKNHSQSPETLLSGRGRGGRGGRGKGRGRGTREEEGTNTGAALDFAPEALEPVYPVTSCSICHGIDDDDLTILCDGNNCSKEAHLYCLQPPLFHVPEGDWYCDTCDPVGTTKHLTEYFQTHDTFAQSISDYEMFLSFLPQRYCSLEDMRVFVPDYCQRIRTTTSSSAEQAESKMETDIEEDSTESHQIRNLLRCEFENEGKEYLGCKVSLLCLIDQRYHTGRILGRRFHQEKQCYEHYVVFKKGSDGRNTSFATWCVLHEHDCMVYLNPIWVRTSKFTWWPVQPFQRSGLHILKNPKEGAFLDSSVPSSSSSSSSSSAEFSNRRKETLVHYLFEDTVSKINLTHRDDVDDFINRGINFATVGRPLQAAYYLALVEVEAIKQAQYMTSLLSMSDIEAVGGLVDGLHTKTLGQISDKDQLRLKELAKFNASSGGGEDHITALQDKLLSDGQNMVHADVLEVIRTAYKDQLRGGKGKASHKAITSQESKGAPNKQNKSTILLDAFHLATEVDTTLSETLFENFTKLPCLYHRVRMQQKNGSNSEEDEDGMDMDGVDSDQDLASIAPIWEIEPVSLTSWIGEEAEAQLKAEQDRRSAEEEEKRRQRKEQQNFRRQEQRRKKQEENERRKQRYQERKALKAALMEEEEREEEELELMATEDLRVQQLQAMEAKAKIGQLGEEHAKEIEEIVKRTNEEAIQMQLLTDIDRSAWIGSIVKDSFSNVVGRVLQYEDGFISIETVEDKVVGRPYEFEVLQPSNEEYQEFEFLKAMDQVANVVNRPKDALDELSGGDDDPDEVEDFQVEDAEGLANYQIGNQFPEKDDAANPNRGKVNLAFSSKKPVPKPKAPTMADIEVYAKERKAKLKEERELQQKRAAKLAELKKQQQEAEKEKELEQKRIAEEAQKAATKVQSPPDGQHSNSNNHRRVLVGDHANPSSYVANNSDSDIENEPIVVASSDYFDRPNPHQPAKPHIRQMHRSDSRDRYSNGGRGFYRGGYRDNRGDYRHNDYRGQGGRWHDDQRRQYSRDDYRRGDYESGEFHRGFRQQYLSSRDDQRLEHHQGRNQPFTLSTRQTEVAVPPPLVYKPDAMDLEDGIPSPPRQMPSSPEATCKLDRSEQDDQLHSVPPSPASSAEVVTLLDDKDDDIPEKSKEGIPTQSSWMVDLTDTDPQPAGMDLDLDIFTMTESRTDINVDEVQERIIFERKLAEEERVYEEEEKAARAIATSSTSSKVVVPSKVPPSGVVKKDISEVQFLEKRSSGIDRKRRSRSRSPPHRPDFKSRRSNSPPKFNRTPSSQVEPPRNNYIPPQSISNFDGRYREERSANSQFQSRHVEDRGGRLQGRFGPASRRGERGGRDNFSAGRGGRGGRGDFIRPTYDRYEDQFNKYLPPPNSDHLVNPNAAIVDALVVPAANASFSPIAEANSSSSSSSAVNTTEDIDDLFNRIRNMQAKASDESVGGAGLKADESSKPVVDHIATKYLADSSPYVEVIPSTSAIEISIAAQVEGVGEEYEPTSLDGVIYGDHKQSNVEGAAPLGLDDISQQLLQAYQQALLVQALNSDCGGDIAALIPNISDLANLVISPELLQALAQSITGPQSYTPGVDSAVMSLLQDQQQQPECVQEYEPTPPSNVANPPFINHGKPVSGQPSFHAKHTFNNSQYGPARSQSQGRGMGRDTHHQGSFSNKNDSQYRNQHSNPRYSSHQQQGQGQSNFHRGGGYEGERGRGDSQRGFSGRYPNRNESGGGPHRQPYRRY